LDKAEQQHRERAATLEVDIEAELADDHLGKGTVALEGRVAKRPRLSYSARLIGYTTRVGFGGWDVFG
jgi:hypothetical protein